MSKLKDDEFYLYFIVRSIVMGLLGTIIFSVIMSLLNTSVVSNLGWHTSIDFACR